MIKPRGSSLLSPALGRFRSAAEEPGFKQKLNTVSGEAEQELSEMQMPSREQPALNAGILLTHA